MWHPLKISLHNMKSLIKEYSEIYSGATEMCASLHNRPTSLLDVIESKELQNALQDLIFHCYLDQLCTI